MPTTRHEEAIDEILKAFPGAARNGFMRAVRKAIPGGEYFGPIGANPDAYLIDRDNRCVLLFEIEATHPVSDEKMERYAGLWWGIDGLDWDLVLLKIAASGVEEIDLCHVAIDGIVRKARENPRPHVSPAQRAWADAIMAHYGH